MDQRLLGILGDKTADYPPVPQMTDHVEGYEQQAQKISTSTQRASPQDRK
jgi:hypothetical protein